MALPYNPQNWYWIVAGSTTQVYSSAVGDYVLVSDPGYQSWLAAGGAATRIDTEVNLGAVLASTNALRPVNAGVLSAWQTASALLLNTGPLPVVLFRALFNHENRIRTLEGKASITAQQFLNGIAALL